jgi:hypothetical protein
VKYFDFFLYFLIDVVWGSIMIVEKASRDFDEFTSFEDHRMNTRALIRMYA